MTETDVQNKRKAYRKACLMVVDFTIKDRFYSGCIKDISVDGAFIESHYHGSIGDEIQLTFSNPDISKPIKLTGNVRRISLDGFGVKFYKYHSSQNQTLEVLVDRIKGGWI